MKNDSVFRIEWNGLKELKNEFKTMTPRFKKIMLEELDKVALECEGYAKDLAFVDTGELSKSINATQARLINGEFVATVGTNLEYAMYVHEIQGQGPKTALKPMIKGYQPGYKFLTNAVKLTESHYNRAMDNALKRLMEGR
ncbi:HK97 gp10 family phage protein [Staphylococcus xylosus]|uniref:HK97 gp10 family phage protein n=1 Tax=Staphylococcus xylosus TaxID=1288 RepID=UPI000E6930F8|nr:HK97 gp10 family phage protein [Staphylococcus xylosus]RIM87758.1 HK97 gp10 family phage protein [Staphylococcus xylosus]